MNPGRAATAVGCGRTDLENRIAVTKDCPKEGYRYPRAGMTL